VARFSASDLNRLLGNDGIVRHRGKIFVPLTNQGVGVYEAGAN
jgi:3-methyladenine DNA glycosylase Tag